MSTYTNKLNTIVIDHIKQVGFSNMPSHHYHNNYELIYLLSGQCYYFVRNRTFNVKAGDFVFIRKEELHNTIDAEKLNLE